MSVWEGESVTI